MESDDFKKVNNSKQHPSQHLDPDLTPMERVLISREKAIFPPPGTNQGPNEVTVSQVYQCDILQTGNVLITQ